MDFKDIKLGKQYWCVLKTTVVDPAKTEYPEFLVHLACGYVTSKGMQKEVGADNGTEVLFVEIAGQRVKYSYIFESPEDAIDKAEAMMSEIRGGTPPTAPEPTVG